MPSGHVGMQIAGSFERNQACGPLLVKAMSRVPQSEVEGMPNLLVGEIVDFRGTAGGDG